MLDRHDVFGRGLGLRQVMDRLMEDAVVMPRGDNQGWSGPATNVYEEDDTLVVEAQFPGVKPENLDINVEQGVLTIAAQSDSEEERTGRNYLVREVRTGRTTRSLRLPATYDADACRADFDHGVLRLTFPKSEAAKPRRIQINATNRPAVSSGPKEGGRDES